MINDSWLKSSIMTQRGVAEREAVKRFEIRNGRVGQCTSILKKYLV